MTADALACSLVVMSAATMDRRLAAERAARSLRGHSGTWLRPLLKDAIPIRTWGSGTTSGFVELDLVDHEGSNAVGEHAYTLTVTDIATGWTENRSVPNKARKWVVGALEEISKVMPFLLLGIDVDYTSLGFGPTCRREPLLLNDFRPVGRHSAGPGGSCPSLTTEGGVMVRPNSSVSRGAHGGAVGAVRRQLQIQAQGLRLCTS